MAASPQYQDALRITQLVGEISRQGPEGRHLCQELLNSVAEFTRGDAGAAGGAP